MSLDVKVTGLSDVVKALDKYGVEIGDLRTAFARVGSIVSKEARRLAPKVSGSLQSSIKPTSARGRAKITAGGDAAPYAGVLHYGGGVGPNRRGPHNIKPHPFLAEAAENESGHVTDQLDREIDRIGRSLGLT